jgi:hypothetical protein
METKCRFPARAASMRAVVSSKTQRLHWLAIPDDARWRACAHSIHERRAGENFQLENCQLVVSVEKRSMAVSSRSSSDPAKSKSKGLSATKARQSGMEHWKRATGKVRPLKRQGRRQDSLVVRAEQESSCSRPIGVEMEGAARDEESYSAGWARTRQGTSDMPRKCTSEAGVLVSGAWQTENARRGRAAAGRQPDGRTRSQVRT